MSTTRTPDLFKFCPRCGSESVALASANKLSCPSCTLTLYFNPTCSAAAMIFDQEGRLMVVERAREPSKGKYGLPGGFADFGERLEEVAARETKEEVNLELGSLTFFATFPNVYSYAGVAYDVTDSYFIGTVESFADSRAEESEVAGIHFVDPAKVPSEQWAFPSLRQAIDKYLRELNSPKT